MHDGVMSDRLIELLGSFPTFGGKNLKEKWMPEAVERLADHLLAGGVVIIDPKKYPPVTNRGVIETICGVPLDEMAELVNAKQEGRIIVPPVELGSRNKVYYPIKGTTVILETKVYGIGVDEDGDAVINPTEYPEKVIEMRGVVLGKHIFLTREEAEKSLAERGGGAGDE